MMLRILKQPIYNIHFTIFLYNYFKKFDIIYIKFFLKKITLSLNTQTDLDDLTHMLKHEYNFKISHKDLFPFHCF